MAERQQRPALQLVVSKEPCGCGETINMLMDLLRQAREGRIAGLAFAVLYTDNNYCPRVTGDARRNPTFARGMVRALDDLLAEHVRGYHS